MDNQQKIKAISGLNGIVAAGVIVSGLFDKSLILWGMVFFLLPLSAVSLAYSFHLKRKLSPETFTAGTRIALTFLGAILAVNLLFVVFIASSLNDFPMMG